MRYAFLILPLLVGCQGMTSDMVSQMTERVGNLGALITEQGVLDRFDERWDLQGVEPGYAAFVRFEVRSGVELEGVSGSIDSSSSGKGTLFTLEGREACAALLTDPRATDDEKASCMTLLGIAAPTQ